VMVGEVVVHREEIEVEVVKEVRSSSLNMLDWSYARSCIVFG